MDDEHILASGRSKHFATLHSWKAQNDAWSIDKLENMVLH